VIQLQPLPLSRGTLARYRMATRRQRRAGMVGGHQVRRKGQSLDFREYEHYQPGDDIRHVDWRASARYGDVNDLLVRHYAAEEQLTMVISIDTRATMHLPESLPKLQIAAWLVEATASIALASQDRIYLHRLFGPAANSLFSLRGTSSSGRIRAVLRRFAEEREETVNLKPLRTCLAPTTVWVIATDLYFGGSAARLAQEIARAQDGYCWVVLIDLDSWPLERAILGEGARRIEGPGLETKHNRFEITSANLAMVETKIRDHKDRFFAKTRRSSCDRVPWHWPVAGTEPATFFRDRFLEDPVIQRLFMKDS